MEWLLDDEIDALIDPARATGDIVEQIAIYQGLQKRLVEQQADVFVLTQTSQMGMSDCLSNFVRLPMQSIEYNFHEFRQLHYLISTISASGSNASHANAK